MSNHECNEIVSLIAGGNANNNNFPSSNAKKFRPSFEGEGGQSQDGRHSPSSRTEPTEQTYANWRQQPQEQQQRHESPLPQRRPRQEKPTHEKENRLV